MNSSIANSYSQLLPYTPERIALFRALSLGDLLLAVPAFRAIRHHFPHAEITLIGLPWAASFVHRFHRYIDRFVEFPGYPGIDEVPVDAERTAQWILEQRNYHYDLIVQMHGSGRTSNPFVLTLGSVTTAGYYEEIPDGLTLKTTYPDDQHEVLRNLNLAALLGCTDLNTRLEFPLFKEDYDEVEKLWCSFERERPVIGIHPGSRSPARRWPAEYFAAVADHFIRHHAAQVVLTGSPDEEETAQAVMSHMRTKVLNLCGKTSLGGLGTLISRLDLFISNDTGPAHIAYAINTPSITLFGPADIRRWAPLDTTRHHVLRRPVACSPCEYWECPIDHRCLCWLLPEVVIHDAQQLLTRNVSCNV